MDISISKVIASVLYEIIELCIYFAPKYSHESLFINIFLCKQSFSENNIYNHCGVLYVLLSLLDEISRIIMSNYSHMSMLASPLQAKDYKL